MSRYLCSEATHTYKYPHDKPDALPSPRWLPFGLKKLTGCHHLQRHILNILLQCDVGGVALNAMNVTFGSVCYNVSNGVISYGCSTWTCATYLCTGIANMRACSWLCTACACMHFGAGGMKVSAMCVWLAFLCGFYMFSVCSLLFVSLPDPLRRQGRAGPGQLRGGHSVTTGR